MRKYRIVRFRDTFQKKVWFKVEIKEGWFYPWTIIGTLYKTQEEAESDIQEWKRLDWSRRVVKTIRG
jgi:hypothetical protein